MRRFGSLLLALTVVLPAVAPSHSTATDWEFGVAPYLWGAGLDGDVKLERLSEQGIEASFSDLLEVLDIGGMLAFEGRRGDFGFLLDAMYFDFEEEVPARDPAFGTVNAELTQQYYTAAATCRVIHGRSISTSWRAPATPTSRSISTWWVALRRGGRRPAGRAGGMGSPARA